MKRIAMVRLSAMGDIVQSLGAVQALRAARPDLELHFVTQAAFRPLLDGIGLQSVLVHERSGGWRALRATRAALRALALDVAVDLQGNWKSALVARLSGATARIGAVGSHRQEPASALLLDHRVRPAGPPHPASTALALLRVIEPALPEAPPALAAMRAEIDAAAEAVRRAGVDPRQPFDLFVVADPADNRAWPLAAMRRQAERGPAPVLWLRGPRERHVALPAGAAVLDHPAGSIRALIALGGVVRAAGGRVLGPDQGPVHVLAATGAETLALFGPQDPIRTRPPAASVLVRRDGPDCVPCRRRRCRHPDGPVCMDFTAERSAAWSLGIPDPTR